MIKFLFCLLFLIPLCFLDCFWLVQFFFFCLSFLFIFFIGFDYLIYHISFYFGCDLLSFCLVLLSFWICSLIILAREKILKEGNYNNLFLLTMVFLIISLFLTFCSLNLFVFYLFFEIRLIPTLLLIVGWGYQPERVEAGVYLLFYTLLVSLPIIIFIFYYYESYFTLDFYLMNGNLNNLFIYFCTIGVFLVKIPMFFIHL